MLTEDDGKRLGGLSLLPGGRPLLASPLALALPAPLVTHALHLQHRREVRRRARPLLGDNSVGKVLT